MNILEIFLILMSLYQIQFLIIHGKNKKNIFSLFIKIINHILSSQNKLYLSLGFDVLNTAKFIHVSSLVYIYFTLQSIEQLWKIDGFLSSDQSKNDTSICNGKILKLNFYHTCEFYHIFFSSFLKIKTQ